MRPSCPIICFGGAGLDRTYLCASEPTPGTSNPVTSRRSFGGVARNVAENLAKLGASVQLISAVGDDTAGRDLSADLTAAGVDARGLISLAGQAPAEYTAAFWKGELFAGFADMGIFDWLTPDVVAPALGASQSDAIIFADCNLPAETLVMLCQHALNNPTVLAVDVVSLAKSERLPQDLSGIGLLFLNAAQAQHMTATATPAAALSELHARGAQRLVLTDGSRGLTISTPEQTLRLAAPPGPVVNVSGAGDAVVAGTLLGLSEGRTVVASVPLGLAVAALTLQCLETVSPHLSRAALDAQILRMYPPKDAADAC